MIGSEEKMDDDNHQQQCYAFSSTPIEDLNVASAVIRSLRADHHGRCRYNHKLDDVGMNNLKSFNRIVLDSKEKSKDAIKEKSSPMRGINSNNNNNAYSNRVDLDKNKDFNFDSDDSGDDATGKHTKITQQKKKNDSDDDSFGADSDDEELFRNFTAPVNSNNKKPNSKSIVNNNISKTSSSSVTRGQSSIRGIQDLLLQKSTMGSLDIKPGQTIRVRSKTNNRFKR